MYIYIAHPSVVSSSLFTKNLETIAMFLASTKWTDYWTLDNAIAGIKFSRLTFKNRVIIFHIF